MTREAYYVEISRFDRRSVYVREGRLVGASRSGDPGYSPFTTARSAGETWDHAVTRCHGLNDPEIRAALSLPAAPEVKTFVVGW